MDFAKILSKIDSIQSTKQLNESAKPDFLDLDKDGNRKESMKKAAADKKKKDVAEAAKGTPHKVRYRYDDPSGKGIASGHITLYAPDKAAAERYAVSDLTKQGKKNVRVQSVTPQKQDVKEDTVNEVSAPGQEDWIKKNKQRFIDQYGKKKGMEVLYATAWKRSKKVDEARQLEECYGQAMQNMSNQMDDRSGMSVSSSMDTRTGSKTLTVSAEGDAADQLAQMLKLSGLVVGTVGSQDVELEEYANEPAPQVQGIETQLQQGNDLNRPKKMTPHGYQNGDNPLAMDVREQEELSALSQALSEELEGIKVDKSKVPAYKRKQRGGDWKTTQQDLQRERERNISGAEGLAALKKKQGMSEAAKPDFLDLDKDGNRKESMKKAAADKKKQGVAEESLPKGFFNGRGFEAARFKEQGNMPMYHAAMSDQHIKYAKHFAKTNPEKAKWHGEQSEQHIKQMRASQKQGVAEGSLNENQEWDVYTVIQGNKADFKGSISAPDEESAIQAVYNDPRTYGYVSRAYAWIPFVKPKGAPLPPDIGIIYKKIVNSNLSEKTKRMLTSMITGNYPGGKDSPQQYYKTGKFSPKVQQYIDKISQQGVAEGVDLGRADKVADDVIMAHEKGQSYYFGPGEDTPEFMAAVADMLRDIGRDDLADEVDPSGSNSGVAEGYKNTYNVGDRVDSPLGTGTIVAVSKNVNVDGRVKVKLDDPSKAGEDGKHKDSFVLTTTQLKHISE